MDDSAAAASVRSRGYVLALPAGLADDGEGGDPAVLGRCNCGRCRGQMAPEMEEESGDEGEEFSDSDDDSVVDVPLKIEDGEEASGGDGSTPPLVSKRLMVPQGRFLEPGHRFASAGSTAGIMRVAAVEPADGSKEEEDEDKQIMVLYRYTHFWAASEGGDGVEVCGSTKLHQLRFVVPPAGDAASSLPWAGSSLAPLIYPAHQRNELQALWSRLATGVAVPPRATRVQVIVDVGILRREDCTRRRMERVRAALMGMMEEPWRGYHVAMGLQLPEPVLSTEESEATNIEEDHERPAKRRKVVKEAAGQECSICFELLESDLVVWPGCSMPHVFHGACLEETLKGNEMCPICRRKLSAS